MSLPGASTLPHGTLTRWGDGLMNGLARLPHARALALTLASLAFVAWLDWVTGEELRLDQLYLIPVTLAVFSLDLRWALLVSALASIGGYGIERLNLHAYSAWHIPVLNWGIHWAGFSIFALQSRALFVRERALEARANTDALTGLSNYAGFQAQAAGLLGQAAPGRPISLLFADLDRFKAVNDRWGHARGDQVLQAFAQALRQGLRGHEACGRLGGDEFAVLLDRDPLQARAFAEGVSQSFRRSMREQGLPVSASFGISGSHDAGLGLAELLRRSDRLMYRAKQRRQGPGRRALDNEKGLPEAGRPLAEPRAAAPAG